MRRFFLAIAFVLLPVDAVPQDDDRGFLQETIEDALSAAGRQVRIIGFEGALSSEAQLTELTIADDDGVWLTLRDVQLIWSRTALLRGRLEVERLTASEILLPRLPTAQVGDDTPSPEAQPFSLPDLPVSVNIGEISAGRISLGPTILGQPVDFSILGALQLDGGAGNAKLEAQRLDGADGTVALDAAFDNESRVLGLSLLVQEDADGLIASLMNIPDRPAVRLSVMGEAPLSDYAADIRLATAGTDRVAGRVTVADLSAETPEAGRVFGAEVSGDVTPLFAPQYQDFFGTDVGLLLAGTRTPEGGLDIGTFELTSEALALEGRLLLAPGGLPERIALTGRISSRDGSAVLLPLGGAETRVESVALDVGFDASESENWTAVGVVSGLTRDGFRAEMLGLDGQGRIGRGADGNAFAVAAFDFSAEALDLGSEDAEAALGQRVSGKAEVDWRAGQPVQIDRLSLTGETYKLDANGSVTISEEDIAISAAAKVAANDLSAFSGLAKRPLSGAVFLDGEGQFGALTGRFDIKASGRANGVQVGQVQVDRLLAGAGAVDLAARRDQGGTVLERFVVETPVSRVAAEGRLTSEGGRGSAIADLADASLLLDGLEGAARIEVGVDGAGTTWQVNATANGAGLRGTVDGSVELAEETPSFSGSVAAAIADLAPFAPLVKRDVGGSAELAAEGSVSFDLRQADIKASLTGNSLRSGIAEADRILAGQIAAKIDAMRNGDSATVRAFSFDSSLLDAEGDARISPNDSAVQLEARLADISPFVADLSGAVTARGTAQRATGDWTLDLQTNGPGTSNARISGSASEDFSTVNVSVAGRAPLELANRTLAPRALGGEAGFDLRIDGAPALGSVSGRVSSSGARFVDPGAGIALDDIAVNATLSSGRVELDVNGAVRDGGRLGVSGPVTLSPPFDGDLSIRLNQVILRDPSLYETNVSGALTVAGPLAGGAQISGRLDLGRTEVQIPSSGVSGPGAIPQIEHRNEPAAVRQTRGRAGLLNRDRSNGGDGPSFGLGVGIFAPNQIFIRGRGLDAELGGRLRISGTTRDVVPIGQFELIRGRLDIFGRRLVLNEGQVTLRGNFDAFLRLEAATDVEDVTIRVVVEGPVNDPQIRFLSSPDLPEDEVVARLLFGKGIDTLSPVQAAQLAASIRTLSGAGGPGLLARLREETGLDDLDVTTSNDGTAAVRAGRYLTDDVYTDVTVDSTGETEINLNFDLSPRVTLKGSVATTGETGIGIFFERDY